MENKRDLRGELVSVKPGANTNQFHKLNTKMIADHGHLWIIIGQHGRDTPEARGDLWDCRSIATGEQTTWFDYEMIRAEEKA